MTQELIDQIRIATLPDRFQERLITVPGPDQTQELSNLSYSRDICRGRLTQLVDRRWEGFEKLSKHGLDGEILFKKVLHDTKAFINTLWGILM